MRMLLSVFLTFIIFPGTNLSAAVGFTVKRHVETTFTSTEFDNAMTDVNLRIRMDSNRCSAQGETPCTASFYRSGSIGTMGATGDGLDIITTQGELDRVFNVTSARVKVVDAIDYCAGRYNTSFVGCGRCNAFGYIVETGRQGNVYVHEYGHNIMGCDHRDTCTGNIMHSITDGTNDSLNASECSDFGGKAYTQLCGTKYDGNGGPLTVAGGPYWVSCNVTVPVGQTLTINPGVEIQFKMLTKISSGGSTGTVDVDGTSSRVLMYSNNPSLGYPTIKVDSEILITNGGGLQPF